MRLDKYDINMAMLTNSFYLQSAYTCHQAALKCAAHWRQWTARRVALKAQNQHLSQKASQSKSPRTNAKLTTNMMQPADRLGSTVPSLHKQSVTATVVLPKPSFKSPARVPAPPSTETR